MILKVSYGDSQRRYPITTAHIYKGVLVFMGTDGESGVIDLAATLLVEFESAG